MLKNHYADQKLLDRPSLELVGRALDDFSWCCRDVFLGSQALRSDPAEPRAWPRNVLAARLDRLVAEEILEKVPYQERPLRHDIRLTQKGVYLWPVTVELLRWGDRYAAARRGPGRSCCGTRCVVSSAVVDCMGCGRSACRQVTSAPSPAQAAAWPSGGRPAWLRRSRAGDEPKHDQRTVPAWLSRRAKGADRHA